MINTEAVKGTIQKMYGNVLNSPDLTPEMKIGYIIAMVNVQNVMFGAPTLDISTIRSIIEPTLSVLKAA